MPTYVRLFDLPYILLSFQAMTLSRLHGARHNYQDLAEVPTLIPVKVRVSWLEATH